MLVDVVPVLEVTVTIVDVVNVVVVFHGFAAVTFGVSAFVLSVNRRLGVLFVAVHVVDVTIVLNGLATVGGQVLVVVRLNVTHDSS